MNIARVIRDCERYEHWAELCFLYIQHEEPDSAAICMIEHPTEAWEHMQMKDVLTKINNSDNYYRVLQFYWDMKPSLLNDMLNTLSSRLDHTRVVVLMRRNGALAVCKPFLQAAQTHNVSAVNEALNELLLEEEDVEALRTSIDAYGDFDHVALAAKLERHELLEMRRVAAYLYKKTSPPRFKQSIELSKKDKLYKDSMETAAESADGEIVEELLRFFVAEGRRECFSACLYSCYDYVKADVVMELAWRHGLMDFAMPFMINFMKETVSKVDSLQNAAAKQKEAQEEKAAQEAEQAGMMEPQQMLYIQDQGMGMQGGMGMQMPGQMGGAGYGMGGMQGGYDQNQYAGQMGYGGGMGY